MTITLANLRKEVLRETGLGMSGTCTSVGTTSTLIDINLTAVYTDTAALNHFWVHRPNAAAAGDKLRRVSLNGFNISTGALTVAPVYTNAPANGEVYELCALVPLADHPAAPYSILRAINGGLGRCWYRDRIVMGRGRDDAGNRFRLDVSEVYLVAALVMAGTPTVTPPTGFVALGWSVTSGSLRVELYGRVAKKDDPENWTFTFNTTTPAAGVIVALVDADTTSPDAATSVASVATGSGFNAVAPAVTTNVAFAKVLRFIGTAGANTFSTEDAVTEIADVYAADPGVSTVGLWAAEADQAAKGAAPAIDALMASAMASVGLSFPVAPRAPGVYVTVADVAQGNNGATATTLVLPRPSNIPNDEWTPNPDSIVKVESRTLPENPSLRDQDESKNGRFWRRSYDPPGVIMGRSPGASEQVLATVVRPYPGLSAEADQTACPTALAVAAAGYELYRYLNAASPSKSAYRHELDMAERSFRQRLAEFPVAGTVEF